MLEVKESDWKTFRRLQNLALERFCSRVLDEVIEVASETDKSSHKRYLTISRQLRAHDRAMADAFNDPARSRARIQVLLIDGLRLWTDDEIAEFSPELHKAIQDARESRKE